MKSCVVISQRFILFLCCCFGLLLSLAIVDPVLALIIADHLDENMEALYPRWMAGLR